VLAPVWVKTILQQWFVQKPDKRQIAPGSLLIR
jgi:hypothetical protein